MSKHSADWKVYTNGNVKVAINTVTGTKARYTRDAEYEPEFAESIDVIISRRCANECPWCYLGCTANGEEADLSADENMLDVPPYTELAINLNDPFQPVENMLCAYRERNVIVNATVSMHTWIRHADYLQRLREDGLMHGIGISFEGSDWARLLERRDLRALFADPRNVLHMVAGLVGPEDVLEMWKLRPKVLILGYKRTCRGSEYERVHGASVSRNLEWLREDLSIVLKGFQSVSFDNLAVEQLNVRDHVSAREWERHYMGDEGTSTFALDLVSRKYALSSLEPEEHWYDMGSLTPKEMFQDLCRRMRAGQSVDAERGEFPDGDGKRNG